MVASVEDAPPSDFFDFVPPKAPERFTNYGEYILALFYAFSNIFLFTLGDTHHVRDEDLFSRGFTHPFFGTAACAGSSGHPEIFLTGIKKVCYPISRVNYHLVMCHFLLRENIEDMSAIMNPRLRPSNQDFLSSKRKTDIKEQLRRNGRLIHEIEKGCIDRHEVYKCETKSVRRLHLTFHLNFSVHRK